MTATTTAPRTLGSRAFPCHPHEHTTIPKVRGVYQRQCPVPGCRKRYTLRVAPKSFSAQFLARLGGIEPPLEGTWEAP